MPGREKVTIFIQASNSSQQSISSDLYRSLTERKDDPADSAKQAIIKLEGLVYKSFDDGPNGAISIGYGFNLKGKGAKEFYNNAKAAREKAGEKNIPTFEEALHKKGTISKNFSDALLTEVIKDKKNTVDTVLKKCGVSLAALPKDFYIGLICEVYHNNAGICKGTEPTDEFKEDIQKLVQGKFSKEKREAYANKRADALAERSDGYKFSNRAVSLGMFFSGESNFRLSDATVFHFVDCALKNDKELKTLEFTHNDEEISWGARSRIKGAKKKVKFIMPGDANSGKTFGANDHMDKFNEFVEELCSTHNDLNVPSFRATAPANLTNPKNLTTEYDGNGRA